MPTEAHAAHPLVALSVLALALTLAMLASAFRRALARVHTRWPASAIEQPVALEPGPLELGPLEPGPTLPKKEPLLAPVKADVLAPAPQLLRPQLTPAHLASARLSPLARLLVLSCAPKGCCSSVRARGTATLGSHNSDVYQTKNLLAPLFK